ncbi:MAG: hypothetical protein ACLFV7_03360 [Phycisphaerae bacterium]
MRKTPDEQRLMERMAPGVLCREGFLGDDPRDLTEIIETDNAAVEKLGVSHPQIADALADLLRKAVNGLGVPVKVDLADSREGRAVFRESMGRIPSPWGGHVAPKGEVELTDAESGEVLLRFTPLSVHLAREHGFYQGRGTRYRIEPEAAVKLLGVAGKEED